ncbi:MAG: hypothetical protein U5J63_03300 [Fodinibius sp.]|nr:hypothetical protein [Fodinibius sp.]
MWKSFYPQADDNDLGPKLLRHEPVPTDVGKRLNICLGESVPENAVGLGIEWSARPELWPEIIQCLENGYTNYDRGQIKLFLDNLQLDEYKVERLGNATSKKQEQPAISADTVGNLIWRSRKVRMKRSFCSAGGVLLQFRASLPEFFSNLFLPLRVIGDCGGIPSSFLLSRSIFRSRLQPHQK